MLASEHIYHRKRKIEDKKEVSIINVSSSPSNLSSTSISTSMLTPTTLHLRSNQRSDRIACPSLKEESKIR